MYVTFRGSMYRKAPTAVKYATFSRRSVVAGSGSSAWL